jgi:lipopolysaccharide transport system ATP-binding protein
MSSSTTRDPLAIRLQNVSKVYRLHGSQSDQLIDVLGLHRFGFKTRTAVREFAALSDVSLAVPRGHRIGIIGRNGAGKTTLLKLICGNFTPTSGEVEVNGTVQALMNIGMGFHPEYTGRENVESSLQYNGLGREEYAQALEGIVEFCELGDFLDQPFKTYSLGMQARLMFAAATAIRPDILIVDEVLGAGDAYFVAKSKIRVDKLVRSGCTMLLVSHSMQQVLELCAEAIWLDNGRVRMQGESFLVVKAYEEYMHGPVKLFTNPNVELAAETLCSEEEQGYDTNQSIHLQSKAFGSARKGDASDIKFQEPKFVPHSLACDISGNVAQEFHFVAPGGISRWESTTGLKVSGFAVFTEQGLTDTIIAMQPAKLCICLTAEQDGHFDCRYGIAINDHLGTCVVRVLSPRDQFAISAGQFRQIDVLLNPCQIGAGEYTVGVSVLDYSPIEQLNTAQRYDLLSRSFLIRVVLPESLGSIGSSFFHSAEWTFSADQRAST